MNPVSQSLQLVWDGPFTLVNARKGHWSKHAAENANLRRWAKTTGTDRRVVFGGPVTIEAHMTVQRGVLPDCDAIAAAVKPVIDGIVDAGVILDDSPEDVRSITYHAPKRSDGRRLVVLVREASATLTTSVMPCGWSRPAPKLTAAAGGTAQNPNRLPNRRGFSKKLAALCSEQGIWATTLF